MLIENTEPTEPTTAQEPTQGLSNSEIKSNPIFQKVTSELAQYKAAEAERKAAEIQTAKDAEIKKAENENRYEDALRLHKEEIEKTDKAHAKELREEKLKAELYKAGFENDIFVAGSIFRYNEESGTVEEYVAAMAADESNKQYLNTGTTPPKPPPPPTGSVTLGSNVSKEQLEALANSSDPAQRMQAVDYKRAYFIKHKKLPY